MPWPDVRAIIAIITTVGTLALMGALVYLKSDQLNTAMGFTSDSGPGWEPTISARLPALPRRMKC